MTTPVFDTKARDLAEKIYRDLCSNTAQVTQSSAAMPADPTALAQMSFALAIAFRKVEDELNAANLPKNQDFKVGLDDLAAWTK